MNNDELQKRLNQLRTEDFVWIIYIGIIIMSLYSNTVERKYFLYNDEKAKEKYRKIMISIFTILVVIYFYFLKDTVYDLKSLNNTYSNKKKDLTYLSFLGSLFIFLSGIIFLYIVVEDENIDVEIAFN